MGVPLVNDYPNFQVSTICTARNLWLNSPRIGYYPQVKGSGRETVKVPSDMNREGRKTFVCGHATRLTAFVLGLAVSFVKDVEH